MLIFVGCANCASTLTPLPPRVSGGDLVTTTAYDLAGQVTGVGNSDGFALLYTYDAAGRQTSEAETIPGLPGAKTVSYQYDAGGNRTRITWPDGWYVDYAYDALGRMVEARENGTLLLATYGYDPLSRLMAQTAGNGGTRSLAYNLTGDLLSLAQGWTGGGVTYTQTYTAARQLSSLALSNPAFAFAPASGGGTIAYAPANALNQYESVTPSGGAAVSLAYDANGNLTGDGTWAYGFDAENRLLSAGGPGVTATYAYDPGGRRVRKTVSALTTFYLSAGAEEIAEYDSGGVLLRRYVPGPGTDRPIAMVVPVAGGTATASREYFQVDRLGSTIAMTGDAGTMSEGPFTYDAYGNSSAPATGVPFRYTGRRLDPETGLYYYRARYYSPALGRFLQTDPIGYEDNLNLYAYVGNDPVNGTDPTGMQEWVGLPNPMLMSKEEMELTAESQLYVGEQMLALTEALSPLADAKDLSAAIGNGEYAQAVVVLLLATPAGKGGKITHHIVAQFAKKHERAREILRSFGIDVNDAENLKKMSERAHWYLHTNKYYKRVTEMLERARTSDEVKEVLESIKNDLEDIHTPDDVFNWQRTWD